ncbi:MAG: hypothetical protein AAGJ54_05990 [Planctomycetota bacterium]
MNRRAIIQTAGAVLSVAGSALANAQNTVVIGSGERFGRPDLAAGSFQGQNFVLGPQTTFDFEDGSIFGGPNDEPFTEFDFGGSRLNLSAGSTFAELQGRFTMGPPSVSNAVVDIRTRLTLDFVTRPTFIGSFSDSTVRVLDGAAVPGFGIGSGSVLGVLGGQVGAPGQTDRPGPFWAGTARVSGGDVIAPVTLVNGSVLEISGGRVSQVFNHSQDPSLDPNVMGPGARVVIRGTGELGGDPFAGFSYDGLFRPGTLELQGGRLGAGAAVGGDLTISGGMIGQGLLVSRTGSVEIYGSEFRINGAAVSRLEITPNAEGGFDVPLNRNGNVLTGTLSDGTVFLLAADAEDAFASSAVHRSDGILREVALAQPDLSPRTVLDGTVTKGLRAGQHLTLSGNATTSKDFAVVDATFNVFGGVVATGLETARSTVRIAGGVIGSRFDIHAGTELTISGGELDDLSAYRGSSARITGGSIELFQLNEGAEVTIAGGRIDRVWTFGGSLQLDVLTAAIDGENLDLAFGDLLELDPSGDGLLEVTLADRTEFQLDFGDPFVGGATIFVRAVPAPGATLLAMCGGTITWRRCRRG